MFADVSNALTTARKLPQLVARIEKLVERAEQGKR
jgi:hypothetical protein